MKAHHYAKRSRASSIAPWDVRGICMAYDWPTNLPGGTTIAIVELGGGWLPSDLHKFCSINSFPVASVADVSVDGTRNRPGVDLDSDGEVALDIQIALASYSYATKGKTANIRVYWSSDIATAVAAAAADRCAVCSISWGLDEKGWSGMDRARMIEALAAASTAGMTVFAASGDNDSGDGGPTPANVDMPASFPSVIACGGTRRLHTPSPAPRNFVNETVWNNNPGQSNGEGTGGGYSTVFPMPLWQQGKAAAGPGRLVPDLAANADPDTGFNVIIAGQVEVVGGTSAVAPLMAGLFAAFGPLAMPVGPMLWESTGCFTDVVTGDNGVYMAKKGPDACTGLGSPAATKIAALFGRA